MRSVSDERHSRSHWAVADLIAAVLVALAFLVVVVVVRGGGTHSQRWLLLLVPVALTWLPLALPRRARLATRVAALISLIAVFVAEYEALGHGRGSRPSLQAALADTPTGQDNCR